MGMAERGTKTHTHTHTHTHPGVRWPWDSCAKSIARDGNLRRGGESEKKLITLPDRQVSSPHRGRSVKRRSVLYGSVEKWSGRVGRISRSKLKIEIDSIGLSDGEVILRRLSERSTATARGGHSDRNCARQDFR